jgi:hypothetical protein
MTTTFNTEEDAKLRKTIFEATMGVQELALTAVHALYEKKDYESLDRVISSRLSHVVTNPKGSTESKLIVKHILDLYAFDYKLHRVKGDMAAKAGKNPDIHHHMLRLTRSSLPEPRSI